MTQADLFTQANALADAGVPKEHVERIFANVAGIPGPRDKPLPFKRIVATRQCRRRNDVVIADLIMFDDKRAELEVFENGKVDGEIVWGGFWSYVPEGFPEFKDGGWRRGDPKAYGVTYGVVHHELDGAKSAAPFLTNQVRQVVKVLMTGGYGIGEIEFEEKAKEGLKSGNSPEYTAARDKYVEFLRAAIEAVPLLKEVAGMDPELMKTRIPAFRDEGWVCLSATGLNMLARLGFEMMRDNEPNWRAYVAKLSTIDWRRTAEIWRGNVVSDDAKRISTAHKSFRQGVEVLKSQIGWTASTQEADVDGPDIEDPMIEAAA